MKRFVLIVILSFALFLQACQPAVDPPPVPSPDEGYPGPGNGEGTTPGEQSPGLDSEPWLAYPPAEGEGAFQRGNFFVDSVRLEPVAGTPGAFELWLQGSLPTPCNAPRVDISQPDANNRIVVDAYSVVDPDVMCTQVIQPFDGVVARLSSYPAGDYTVVVNDQPPVTFTIP
jgi:hypothetical protein